MRIRIDEYLAEIEEREHMLEQRACKHSKARGFSTKMPKSFFEHPIYEALNDIIICKDRRRVMPRRWDELEIDFEDNFVRTFRLCKEKVYKVSNTHNYNKIKNKNVFIAVPLNSMLFKNIYDEFKEQIDIFRFVQISRRFIQESGYRDNQDIHNCNTKKVIQSILSMLISRSWIDYQSWIADYQKFDLDLDEVLSDIVRYIGDEELLELIAHLKTL